MAVDRDNSVPSTLGEVASLRRRLRPSRVLGLLVTLIALTAGATEVTAAAPAASPSALSGPLIVHLFLAPASGAMLTGSRVRVVVQAPRGQRLVIKLNQRDITRRLRGRGSVRSAVLTGPEGLLRGVNNLYARTFRGRHETGRQARYFLWVTADRSVASTRLGGGGGRLLGAPAGPSGALSVSVTQPSALGGRPLGATRASKQQVALPPIFRAWLNGRGVTRFFSSPRPGAWAASLSADVGLRFGKNTLRTLVVDQVNGRYVQTVRVVNVPRDRPLAAAGLDRQVSVGTRVRLDGGNSRATIPGLRLSYRWRLVHRPRGSRAALIGATSRRPRLLADRPGRYRVQLVVGEQRPQVAFTAGVRHAALAPVASAPDEVTVAVQPVTPLIDGVNTQASDAQGNPGIQVGQDFYPNPSPDHRDTQILVLERDTLAPVSNSYTDGSNDATHGIVAVYNNLKNSGLLTQIAIISKPASATPAVPAGSHQSDRVRAYDNLVQFLGGSHLDSPLYTQPDNPLSVVGVPGAPTGAQWVDQGAIRGGYIRSGGNGYQFSPAFYGFDTATMDFPDLPGGGRQAAVVQPGGFNVVVLDHTDLGVRQEQSFFTIVQSRPDQTVSDLKAMHNVLQSAIARHDPVFVQGVSVHVGDVIGHLSNTGIDAWNTVVQDMVQLGGTFDVLNRLGVDGDYALVGGKGLPHGEVAEVSNLFSPDGSIHGYFTLDHEGRYHAVLGSAAAGANLDLYPLIHQAPTPWPCTDGPCPGGPNPVDPNPDHQAYRTALAWVTKKLGFNLTQVKNLRDAYVRLDNTAWGTVRGKLDGPNLKYPGGTPGFTSAQLANLKTQLDTELDDLVLARNLFDAYKEPFALSQGNETNDLNTLTTSLINAIAPPDTSILIAVATSVISGALLVVAPYALLPEQAVIGAVTTAVGLGGTILTSATNGSPVSDAINAKARDLAAAINTSWSEQAIAINGLYDVVAADWGKLQAASAASTDTNWSPSTFGQAAVGGRLQLAARQSFYAALLPVAYNELTTIDCSVQEAQALFPFFLPVSDPYFYTEIVRKVQHGGAPEIQTWEIGFENAPPAGIAGPITTPIDKSFKGQPGLGLFLSKFISDNWGDSFPAQRSCEGP